jgi:ribose-phosphate pyrophosphokinase
MSNIQLLATKDGQPFEVPFKAWKFPAGEIGVQLLEIEGVDFNGCSIMWKYTGDNDDLMRVLQLRDAIYQIDCKIKVSLVIPYLPYSRQDRVCHPGESLALNIFMQTITVTFWDIYTFDVHNEQAFLSNNFYGNLHNIGQEVCASNLPKYDYFIAPDDGAARKIYKHRQVNYAENATKVITMKKTRVDGKVIYEPLPFGTIPVGSKVCVVDDLCDGGATFLSVMDAIDSYDYASSKFDFYVTHGIFTNKEKFMQMYDLYYTIYTCNMMNTDPEIVSKVQQLNQPMKGSV